MRIDELRQRLRALGAGPDHERRFLRLWVQGLPQDSGRRPLAEFLPARLRAALPQLGAELANLASLHSQHAGQDGSARLLLRLADGLTAEGVLLPRQGLCVSSQVGCAVGCVFCMTGREGLVRHLGSAEIIAQVVLARSLRAVRKVVFMGMGEPAHNLDNVMDAIELLGTAGGFAHKNLVFSTVGDPRVFERLPHGPVRPALALSLHTTRAELRERLLPRAPRLTPDELVELAERYARDTGYPIQYQWTLLEGINDGDDEIAGIVRLLHGKYAVMNLIPYNSVPGLPYRRPAWERAVEIARMLHWRGILTTLRDSAAQDVDGGCGQLRARALAPASA
ncbi:MAG: RNA methyltransferase [Pseudomonadota bacterium]|nr:RNA methyltransferase [Pseudomonadota bacterium]